LKVEIRTSSLHGKGMFAVSTISKGEIVAIWGGNYVSKEVAEQARKTNRELRVQQIDDEVFEVFSKEEAGYDPTYFHNHSCDPNTWMDDEVTISAKRDIASGEELTIDYAMFEGKDEYVAIQKCECGSPRCRGKITGGDWRLANLQDAYRNHFSPMLNRRIKETL
jgi:SET domain-containing protein